MWSAALVWPVSCFVYCFVWTIFMVLCSPLFIVWHVRCFVCSFVWTIFMVLCSLLFIVFPIRCFAYSSFRPSSWFCIHCCSLSGLSDVLCTALFGPSSWFCVHCCSLCGLHTDVLCAPLFGLSSWFCVHCCSLSGLQSWETVERSVHTDEGRKKQRQKGKV